MPPASRSSRARARTIARTPARWKYTSRTASRSRSPDPRSTGRPPACCARRSRATPSEPIIPIDCCIRCAASAGRARGASRESAGTRRSRPSPRGFRAIAAEDPEQILPYSYAGTMGLVQGESMAQRFFHQLGASLLDRTICASAGPAGHKITLGREHRRRRGSWREEAKLIIFWGCNAITSSVHFWARAQEAKRRGATPHRHRSLSLAHRREMPRSTSPCCPAPTGRWRSD